MLRTSPTAHTPNVQGQAKSSLRKVGLWKQGKRNLRASRMIYVYDPKWLALIYRLVLSPPNDFGKIKKISGFPTLEHNKSGTLNHLIDKSKCDWRGEAVRIVQYQMIVEWLEPNQTGCIKQVAGGLGSGQPQRQVDWLRESMNFTTYYVVIKNKKGILLIEKRTLTKHGDWLGHNNTEKGL